jgi:hypothetical protein
VSGGLRATAPSTTSPIHLMPLGPRPEQQEQQHQWESARETIEQGEQRLGRDVETERDVDLGIGL